jgi:hypothetical protein
MATFGHLYSSYLKASDFVDPRILTVTGVKAEKVSRDDDKPKVVLYVEEDERGIVLNKGRFNSMIELTGSDDGDDWIGTTIQCVQVRQSFAGKPVMGFGIVAP